MRPPPIASPLLALLLWGCGTPPSAPCACANGHGVTLCEGDDCTACQCLDLAPPTEDPVPTITRFVDADASDADASDADASGADASGGDGSAADPWSAPNWDTLDHDVATGDVLVVFDANDTWPALLPIGRTDTGPYRIVLDGHRSRRTSGEWVDAQGARAVVPGVGTGFEDVVRSRITVRGFDITGSKDKGIYWYAGDEIVIEDNLVHANRGSPSVSLEYTSRSGHRSTSFVVRNNHIWDQSGECIYIGGAEGEDIDAHEVVIIENNLVHDCASALSSQDDGINIKDRIGSVLVSRNVVFNTKWGIELASPSTVRGNLTFATRSDGIHVTDDWGRGASGMVLQDDVILDADEAGIYMNATSHAWSDVTLSRLTVIGARQAAIEAGGEAGIDGTIDDVVLADASIGLNAWSPMGFTLGRCIVHGNELDGDGEFVALSRDCVDVDPGFGDLGAPAGPDGRFFTDDDPWISASGGARPTGW